MHEPNDLGWYLPVALDVLPADGPGGLVALAGSYEGVEVSPPDHDAELGAELAGRWRRIRDHHRERLSSSLVSFNGELPLVRDLDPRSLI